MSIYIACNKLPHSLNTLTVLRTEKREKNVQTKKTTTTKNTRKTENEKWLTC